MLLFLFLLLPIRVLAGGGRYELGPSEHTYINSPAEIRAVIHSPSDPSQPSAGEHVQFVITNPRSGDSCSPTTAVSDASGNVSSLCTAQTPGQIAVYIHSTDNNDDSNPVSMTFDPLPQQPTSTPPSSSSQATPTPTPSFFLQRISTPTIAVYIQPTRVFFPSPTPTTTPTPTLLPTPTHTVKKQLTMATHTGIPPFLLISVVLLLVLINAVYFWRRKKNKNGVPTTPPHDEDMQQAHEASTS